MSYNPWRHLRARADITFGITDLPAGDGWWLPDIPAIVLDSRLSRIARRCVLAHELVHADNNETQCAANGRGAARIARRRERHADETAARRLVTLDDLVDALRWALGFDELAELLDVEPAVARTRILELTGDEKQYIESRLTDEMREIA